jgi:hypothetical protein
MIALRVASLATRYAKAGGVRCRNALLLDRQHRELRVLGAGGKVRHRRAQRPVGDGLLADAMAFGQTRQAHLTMLYRSADRLRRCGAAGANARYTIFLQLEGKLHRQVGGSGISKLRTPRV